MSVSDKRKWIEQTIASLEGGFDKKKLLEDAQSLDDPEIRSLIATSITGSMAKRKLEQYLGRLSSPENAPEAQSPDPSPQAAGDEPPSGPAADPELSVDSGRTLDPEPDPERPVAQASVRPAAPAQKPEPPAARTELPSEESTEPSREAAKQSSGDRFARLEKTVLASKSSDDLSVPDIPDDMIGTIRQLKDLARKKTRQKPPAQKPPSRSDEKLLDALSGADGPHDPDAPQPTLASEPETHAPSEDAGIASAGAAEPINRSAPASKPSENTDISLTEPSEEASEPSGDAEVEGTVEEFEEFLSEPSEAVPASGGAQDSDVTLEEFDEFLNKPSEDAEEKTELFSEKGIEPVPAAAQTAQPESTEHPADYISQRFDDLLATMGEISSDMPHPESPRSPEPEAASGSEPTPPEQPAEPPAPREQPPATVRTTPKEPTRTPPDAQAPSEYDGSWIEGCENITDIIDALETVEGSVEEIRTTIALYVLGFSEDLARTIRTAQDRNELELMLRKALTATIDDAFDRTAARFAKERESFAREAQVAADAFDRAVTAADEESSEHAQEEDEAIDRAQAQYAQEQEELAREAQVAADAFDRAVVAEEERMRSARTEAPVPAAPAEPARTTDVLSSARAVHERAERESAEDVSVPVPKPAKPARPSIAARVAEHIESLHDLIEAGEYDEAFERLEKARELLARQITLKEHRNESVVDERMADFELKGLALDLEILKARQ